ncbi:MAG: hypothetical protein JWO42_234 [Chloroflexi bacterium]|jgi:hypothetical protein|nr:hypothetical protein [Chloroflexota bacterium]
MSTEENILQGGQSGDMDEDRAFRRLVRSVDLTQDEEIDCTTCLEQVPVYVDRELAGADVAKELPELHLHLALCGDCFEEYEALRDLVELDVSGDLPDTATLLEQLDGRNEA